MKTKKIDYTKPNWISKKFKDGTYEIAQADENGVLVFRDAIFEKPFDDKEHWTKTTNVWEKSTLKKELEKWFNKNAPEKLKEKYDVDLLADYEIFDKDQLSKEYRIGKQLAMFKDWHNRIKGLKGDKYSTWWWTKTAYRGSVGDALFVYSYGCRSNDFANDSNGVVPCLRPKH